MSKTYKDSDGVGKWLKKYATVKKSKHRHEQQFYEEPIYQIGKSTITEESNESED